MKEEKTDARNKVTRFYIFGELSPPLMTSMFVDGAARARPAAPAPEGGLVLPLSPPTS
jgi:hypothetical protein